MGYPGLRGPHADVVEDISENPLEQDHPMSSGPLASKGGTYPAPEQTIGRIVDPRDPTLQGRGDAAARIGGRRGAAHDVDERLAGREARLGAGQIHAGGAARARVGEDADDLVAVEALAHGDRVVVVVDWVRLVGEVLGILMDRPAADLVQGGYPLVWFRVCCVSGEPDGLPVVGDIPAGVGLFLTLVYDWDTWYFVRGSSSACNQVYMNLPSFNMVKAMAYMYC